MDMEEFKRKQREEIEQREKAKQLRLSIVREKQKQRASLARTPSGTNFMSSPIITARIASVTSAARRSRYVISWIVEKVDAGLSVSLSLSPAWSTLVPPSRYYNAATAFQRLPHEDGITNNKRIGNNVTCQHRCRTNTRRRGNLRLSAIHARYRRASRVHSTRRFLHCPYSIFGGFQDDLL